MRVLVDLLRFRILVAPYILELLFWAGVAGTLYGSIWLLNHGHWAWWIALVFGTLATRVLFEFALLAFRAYDELGAIRTALQARQPDPPTKGGNGAS